MLYMYGSVGTARLSSLQELRRSYSEAKGLVPCLLEYTLVPWVARPRFYFGLMYSGHEVPLAFSNRGML